VFNHLLELIRFSRILAIIMIPSSSLAEFTTFRVNSKCWLIAYSFERPSKMFKITEFCIDRLRSLDFMRGGG